MLWIRQIIGLNSSTVTPTFAAPTASRMPHSRTHFHQLSRAGGPQRQIIQSGASRWQSFNVTAHPTAEWTAQQLREAFPFDQLPRYLLRDRDAIFGQDFRDPVRDMGIREVLSAPRSPWQRAYVERVIGSIRRECLDQVIVFHESSLGRTLNSYFDY